MIYIRLCTGRLLCCTVVARHALLTFLLRPLLLLLLCCQVTKNRNCRVRISILPADGNHGEEFKVMGIAVVPYTDLPPLTSMDYRFLQSV